MYALYNQEHFDILFDSCLKGGELCVSFLKFIYMNVKYLYKVFHGMVGLTVS